MLTVEILFPEVLLPRLLFEDECSTESKPHFNDEPNCSQASPNTSNCIPDDSLGSIIGSEEEYSLLFDESPDESVNEESHLGEVSHEQFPLEKEEPLYTGSRLTQAQSFFTYTFICFETWTHRHGSL